MSASRSIPSVLHGNSKMITRPKAVLFDLFHTLVNVPPRSHDGERSIPEILGIPPEEWQRLYYDEDVIGRCLGHVRDSVEAMRMVTHSIDPTVKEDQILAAVKSRRRRFEMGLVKVDHSILEALENLRAAGIRTAIVSYEVGYRKPDPRIYRTALSALGASPEDAIFVGDGGSDEHTGARAVGLRSVLVTRLFASWWPEKVAARRGIADWEFEDVPAFVAALGLPEPQRSKAIAQTGLQ